MSRIALFNVAEYETDIVTFSFVQALSFTFEFAWLLNFANRKPIDNIFKFNKVESTGSKQQKWCLPLSAILNRVSKEASSSNLFLVMSQACN